MTDRESFCAALSNGPLLRGDAIVVLCGEDGEPRADVAEQLMRQDAAPVIVLSGGLDSPPNLLGAKTLHSHLMGKGVSPTRIIEETESKNTREQAVNVVALAVEKGWKRLLLVASPYHQYRAFLSFVKALDEAGQTEKIQLVNVPASQTQWFGKPAGCISTRIALLQSEFKKLHDYAPHVASCSDGLKYLQHWESR